MPILKKVKGGYSNNNSLLNLVKYIFNPRKMPSMLYGGQGINLYMILPTA